MTVHCRIMKIDIEKFSADLTCRTSDLMDRNNEWKLPKDTYYDFDAEAADHKQEEDMKRKQQRTSECSAGGLHLNMAYTRDLGCGVPMYWLTAAECVPSFKALQPRDMKDRHEQDWNPQSPIYILLSFISSNSLRAGADTSFTSWNPSPESVTVSKNPVVGQKLSLSYP